MTAPRVTVTTGSAAEAQGLFARDALRSQRQRFAALLRSLDDDAWAAESRCTEWSVHQVVRHLCDVTLKSTALLRGESPEEVGTLAVDPRTTPNAWLARSAGERPQDTLVVFEKASAELLEAVDRRVGQAANGDVAWLYGPVPWSIAVLHVFWDAWVHERDILTPLRGPHDSPAIESCAAATYGLTMSCLPVLITGAPLDDTVVLTGAGGGVFRLDVCNGGPNAREFTPAGYRAVGQVTITVGDSDGGVEPLRGALDDVVDSLVGRGPALGQVLNGPSERVQLLERFRTFLLLPAA
jgi:uncharacterized protein (TIGR03083 family)